MGKYATDDDLGDMNSSNNPKSDRVGRPIDAGDTVVCVADCDTMDNEVPMPIGFAGRVVRWWDGDKGVMACVRFSVIRAGARETHETRVLPYALSNVEPIISKACEGAAEQALEDERSNASCDVCEAREAAGDVVLELVEYVTDRALRTEDADWMQARPGMVERCLRVAAACAEGDNSTNWVHAQTKLANFTGTA